MNILLSLVKYGGSIPSINWDPPTVITLSMVCTNDNGCQGTHLSTICHSPTILVHSGKAIGTLQVCKENGDMTINLNGHDDDNNSEFYSSDNSIW